MRNTAAVVGFHVAVLGLAARWLYLLPCDATDLCYLLSLEEGSWVTQEIVHPLWVPALRVLRFVVRGCGWHGSLLVPIEAANVVASAATLVLLFHLARRWTGDAIVAAAAVLLLPAVSGFGSAAMRPTPYAPAFLFVVIVGSLLVGETRPSPLRYLLAGAAAGIATSLHASAMALAPAALACAALDPARRSTSDVAARVAAFGAGLSCVAAACLAVWLRSNGLHASFLAIGHLRSMFAGVEQVPGTSIYSSRTWGGQIAGLCGTLWRQGSTLLVAGTIAAVAESRRRLQGAAARDPPRERRLRVATVAVFATVAGFFLVNNDRNGFVYASLALVPLFVAQAAQRAPRARRVLAATPVLTVPIALFGATAGTDRFHDPLPQEVRFVAEAAGPRAVLLVPGCAFDELRMLSDLNAFRIDVGSAEAPEGTSGPPLSECPLPNAVVGDVLRARVRAWRRAGVVVLYAYGDETDDFAGDANGREKEVELFWDPRLAAKDRAPHLQAVRAALASAGLRLGDPIVSPRGSRYAEVTAVDDRDDPSPPDATCGYTPAAQDPRDRRAKVVARVVARLHGIAPGDPWAACDAVCTGVERRTPGDPSTGSPCDGPGDRARTSCGCPGGGATSPRRPDDCQWGPNFDRDAAEAYLRPWAKKAGLDPMKGWTVDFDGNRADVRVQSATGTLWMSWKLLPSCDAGPVTVRSEGLAASEIPSADAVRAFAVGMPAPREPGE